MSTSTVTDAPAESTMALLAMEDAEFVLCAYLSVLGRPADPRGFSEYLGQIRAGANKSEILMAIATSPEARLLNQDRLPGLVQFLRETKRRPATFFWTRIIRRITRRIDVCEYRIGKIEQTLGARLNRLENEMGILLRERQLDFRRRIQAGELSRDPDLNVRLQRMSLHARTIYFRLENSLQEHLRTIGK